MTAVHNWCHGVGNGVGLEGHAAHGPGGHEREPTASSFRNHGAAPPHDEAGDYSPYLTLAGKLRLQAEDTLRNSCFVDPNEGLVTSLVYSGGSEGYPNGLGIFRNPQISQSFFEMFRC